MGWRKGIPRDLMDGLTTDKIEKLVLGWPKKLLPKTETFGAPNPSAHSADLVDLTALAKPMEN